MEFLNIFCAFRLLASDTNGVINVWDRRVSDLPCLELTTNSPDSLNSIKLSGDNEVSFKIWIVSEYVDINFDGHLSRIFLLNQ